VTSRQRTRTTLFRTVAVSTGLLGLSCLLAYRAIAHPEGAAWTWAAVPPAFCLGVAIHGLLLARRINAAGLRRRRELEESRSDWRKLVCAAICSSAMAGMSGFGALGVILYFAYAREGSTR
jgi:hypothetical protein